jgi:hypothetical protein
MRDPPWIIMRVKTPALESYGLALPRLASISRVRCLPLPSCVAAIFLHNRSLLAVRQKPSGGSDGSYGLLRSVGTRLGHEIHPNTSLFLLSSFCFGRIV